jgi:acyl carrier protein
VPTPIADVTAIVRAVLHDRDLELAPATRFDDLAGWDSMDLIAVIVEVECRFDLMFELPEIERLANVGDLLKMIEVKRARALAA